ncbi:hypothetical protein [Piscinibacter gummiphilus]|uniref:Uncharacterized protein n=1 Tax=Piscinibacter gummiphilus TaxID=946333 RepID=A0ABZ0CNY9_9BURK|nr:hypothetical protein [Piscinibacter gummiphilus]WOB06563.1 hypothetical protein RXV79_16715 [Piscinibacter gummiphilus]
MIGDQIIGRVAGVVVSSVAHVGLTVTVNGRPARLAIVAEDGRVVASGDDVAKEVEAVAVNSYRNLIKGQGHLRVFSNEIAQDAAA